MTASTMMEIVSQNIVRLCFLDARIDLRWISAIAEFPHWPSFTI